MQGGGTLDLGVLQILCACASHVTYGFNTSDSVNTVQYSVEMVLQRTAAITSSFGLSWHDTCASLHSCLDLLTFPWTGDVRFSSGDVLLSYKGEMLMFLCCYWKRAHKDLSGYLCQQTNLHSGVHSSSSTSGGDSH